MSTLSSRIDAYPVRQSPPNPMRWGAIFAGLAVGIAVHLLLMILAAAAGFSAFDAGIPRSATDVSVAAATWNTLSILLSAFFGGFVAARMSGLGRTADGVLYGIVTWGATTLFFAVLAAGALGSLGSSLFASLQTSHRAAPSAADTSSAANRWVAPRMPGAESPPRQHWEQYRRIRARQDAIAGIEQALQLPAERAARVVDYVLAQQPAAPGDSHVLLRQLAEEQAIEAAGATRWWLFAALLGSLLAGIGGGALGARAARGRRGTVLRKVAPSGAL
jgi:hypothetical protein